MPHGIVIVGLRDPREPWVEAVTSRLTHHLLNEHRHFLILERVGRTRYIVLGSLRKGRGVDRFDRPE